VSDATSQTKFKEASGFIKGFATQDEIANVAQLEEKLKFLLDKKVGAETYAVMTNTIIENMDLFDGLSISPQMSMTLPGRDIYLSKSSKLYFPVLEKAVEDLVAGKRKPFVAMVALTGGRGGQGRGSGQEPIIFIFDKETAVDSKKLEEIPDTFNVTITPVTKNVIEEWKKNQVDGKEKVVNELIQFQPSLQDMRSRLLQMELDELQEALDQMRGTR
jgi:hypothetical protein